MKILFFLFLINLPQLVFSQSERAVIRNLQKGKLQEDTSYVYWLPYQENTSQLMVQGYLTKYSHKTLVANDFKMKSGTIICASRAGVVFDVMEASNIGGLKDKEKYWRYHYTGTRDWSKWQYWLLCFSASPFSGTQQRRNANTCSLFNKTW
jgi:hypothetical protein